MESLETVKVGNFEVRKDALKGITLEEAKAKFPRLKLDDKVITKAWELCNPKKPTVEAKPKAEPVEGK